MKKSKTLESLKELEKKISNPEYSLWYLLSILDPDIHRSLKEKLLESSQKLDEAEVQPLIDYSNLIMDAHDEDSRALLVHAIENLLASGPNTDKIPDTNRILMLENHLDKETVRKLDRFQSHCLKGTDDEES